MKTKSRYSLQRTMIIYFLLIGYASVLVRVECMADFHSGSLKTEIWENIQRVGQYEEHQQEIFAPIDRMRSKAMLMVGIILVVMIIVLTMFIKNVTEPLQHMIQLSERISAGDLSQTVRIEANNGLADLGNQNYGDQGMPRVDMQRARRYGWVVTLMAVASGMLSVSIGEWVVPLMRNKMSLRMGVAIATSIATIFGVCLFAATLHLWTGAKGDLNTVLWAVPGVLIGGQLGPVWRSVSMTGC